MNTKTKIAFVCYLIPAIVLAVFGMVYLFSPTFMPYHQGAVGISWSDLEPPFKILILASLRGISAGQLATSLAIIILLFIPFKSGARWARWAIVTISLAEGLPLLYAVLIIKLGTPASPPLIIVVACLVLSVLGFVLSFDRSQVGDQRLLGDKSDSDMKG